MAAVKSKKKKPVLPKSAPDARSTEAFKHGKEAFGARQLKPGFAFTPEQDLWFSLGYPNVTFLFDDPSFEAALDARKLFMDKTSSNARAHWPRGVAYRFVRAFDQLIYDEPLRAALAKPATPVREGEARELIHRYFEDDCAGDLLLLLEGMVGPDVVADAALELIESRAETFIATDRPTYGRTIYDLGFVLLRLPAVAAESARRRLEALYQTFSARKWFEVPSPIRVLDVILHGALGSERSGHRSDERLSPAFFGHVTDDPAYVTKYVKENLRRFFLEPDARRAFLGGAETLECELTAWRSEKSHDGHRRLVESFGAIQSPLVLPFMLELSAKSKAKREAIEWFRAHADFSQDFLARTAKRKGAAGVSAKAVLARIS